MCASLGGSAHAVSQAAHSLDGALRKLLAQTRDEDVDGVGVAVEVLPIDVVDEFVARYDFAGTLHEYCQHPIFMAGEAQRGAIHSDPGLARIKHDVAAGPDSAGMSAAAADQRAQPCQQFLHVERLGEIVVA